MALDGNVLANTWEGTWTDRETGKAMAGRGVEVWAMRDGMIAVWDAAFNIWEHGRRADVPRDVRAAGPRALDSARPGD